MKTFEQKINDYANLIVKVGMNLQKGQNLIITAPIETHDFIKKIAENAYKAGVKEIYYRWISEELELLRYMNADDSVFKTYPQWMADGYESVARDNTATLSIYASNPELFKDVDPDKIKNDRITKSTALKKYKDFAINGGCNWCIVSVPTEGWANSIFKNDNSEENISKLWDLIFQMNRINEENPIDAWKEHFKKLEYYKAFLNDKNFKKLYYKSDKTDLTVELPKEHLWAAALEDTLSGITFSANMPTEEVYTAPHKYGVNGKLYSTFPLEYGGNRIENFSFTFKDGKVIDFEAEAGYDVLKNLLDSDEGSKYLGEVAIVPIDSPIYQSKTIFCNTLYDENASCHFALGSAYLDNIKDGKNIANEDKEKHGINDSIIHEDFMVGNENLSISGETHDCKIIEFFKNGRWTI